SMMAIEPATPTTENPVASSARRRIARIPQITRTTREHIARGIPKKIIAMPACTYAVANLSSATRQKARYAPPSHLFSLSTFCESRHAIGPAVRQANNSENPVIICLPIVQDEPRAERSTGVGSGDWSGLLSFIDLRSLNKGTF